MKLKLRNATPALLVAQLKASSISLLVASFGGPFLVLSVSLFLATAAFAAPPQPVAEAELQALFAKYADLDRLSVDFTQTKTLKDIPTKLKSSGHLDVQAPDALTWTLLKPSFLEFELVKGDAQITSGTGTDRTVQKFTKAQMASSAQAKSLEGLASWLKFDAGYLLKEYKISKDESGALEFAPKSPETSPFAKIHLEFSKTQTVKHLTLSETSGDVIELEFQTPKIQKRSPQKPHSK